MFNSKISSQLYPSLSFEQQRKEDKTKKDFVQEKYAQSSIQRITHVQHTKKLTL